MAVIPSYADWSRLGSSGLAFDDKARSRQAGVCTDWKAKMHLLLCKQFSKNVVCLLHECIYMIFGASLMSSGQILDRVEN